MTEIITIQNVHGYEKDGTVYLKLEDVARGLGFTTVATSGNEVVRWARVRQYLQDFGFGTSAENSQSYIPENIFYRLAMKAKNETAEKFQVKVADEILPAIRKHGAYFTPKTFDEILKSPAHLMTLLQNWQEDREKLQQAEKLIEEQKPKVIFADAVETSHSSILVGELAKLIKQNGVDIGQNRLFDWLRDNGYLIKGNRADKNMPTQAAMEMNLFEVKERTINNPDGSIRITRTPKVTGKGQTYFVNKLLKSQLPTT